MRRAISTVRGQLLLGLLALLATSAVSATLALQATWDVAETSAALGRLAERGRLLARVGSLSREYYLHQAHLALGMSHGVHAHHMQAAREALAEALDAADEKPPIPAARRYLARVDLIVDTRFLPAVEAGRQAEAIAAHDETAALTVRLIERLEATHSENAKAIRAARAKATTRAENAAPQSAIALGFGLIAALIIGGWMSRNITGPVARLRRAALALPHNPEGTRVPIEGPLEVRALGHAFNQMLDELEIQRRRRTEAETLAGLGRVAAGLAHEINNPLGVILGHARFIERADNESRVDARAIAEEARLCQAIVRDLLDYARPGLARHTELELGDLAHNSADRRGGVVHGEAPGTLIGDSQRLTRLLDGLLENATAHGGTVEIHLSCATSASGLPGVRAEVIDDGPGVPDDLLEQIFEPFFTTRAEGTGLGLALARSVAIAHGGSLHAEPGPGGRFILWLPVSNTQA